MAEHCTLWTKRIACLRLCLCLLPLMVADVARADYVFSTFNGVVRYSSNGQRMFNYQLADPFASLPTQLAESVDSIGLVQMEESMPLETILASLTSASST